MEKFTKVPGEPLLCKVQTWEKDSHSLELEIMTIDINVYKDVLNLEKQIADTLNNEKNPFTRQQKITDLNGQIAEKTQKLYKPSGVKFDVKTQEDFALRCKELHSKFDEKGNLVIPTEKEKKEKRDKNPPHYYIADPEDLHANTVIQVHFVRKEGSNAKVPDILRLGPRPGSDPPAQAIKMDTSLVASMIVIVGNMDQPKP